MIQMFDQFVNFFKNPMEALLRTKLGIPKDFQGNENDMIQYLLNSGKITQQQYNEINARARQIEKSPEFQNVIKGMQSRT